MARTCPTCGQAVGSGMNAPQLLDLLKNGHPHREVYRAQAGDWWVTYGGGEVAPEVVHTLVASGLIKSVYSSCPDEVYHVGKTLDTQATIEERKKHRRGKDAPRIYTDGTRSSACNEQG